ncbi:gamma-glutamyltransferase [Halalkalibacter sp. MEB205]|uniref:Gamma-glutamyltransferase n=1 Tax=Halalkalibacter alkaliphilus TaxID=2917993 RepID=A0A9X2I6Q8_9BACI|nr:gamma-glutamyltransferase [Halalkalibacter alkaliphilus]
MDFCLNPQAALDATRWMWSEGKKIYIQCHLAPHIAEELARRGHDIKMELVGGQFGRGKMRPKKWSVNGWHRIKNWRTYSSLVSELLVENSRWSKCPP